jgi:ABC-type multidrug transport system permease subunit
MPLGNPRSIVKQTILLCSFLRNLLFMISPCYWFLGIAFSTAVLSAFVVPSTSVAIALVFCLLGMSLFPMSNQLTNNYLNRGVKGGVKGGIVLLSLIAFCLVVPQVETNTAVFTSPIDHLKNHRLT